MSDLPVTPPRRRQEPPDEPGLWIRYIHGKVKPFDAVIVEGHNWFGKRKLICPNLIFPREAHCKGDSWEGPFPVPSLPASPPETPPAPNERTDP